MANTTNYNWETPDDTDLVKDGAAAIRTLGSSIDTTTKNLNPQTTTGALAYRSATANVNTALPIGTTGQVLTVASGVPSWAAPAAGGKVLQVVYANYATQTSNSTSTYADTGLTASITPSSASSKVLVLVTVFAAKSDANSLNRIAMNLVRGSTQVIEWLDDYGFFTATAMRFYGTFSFNYLDSPSSTSSLAYKVQFKNIANVAAVEAQAGNVDSSMTLIEIGA